jgi:hypothetical protein
MLAGITSGLACQKAKFTNSTPVIKSVTMLIGTTYGASAFGLVIFLAKGAKCRRR